MAPLAHSIHAAFITRLQQSHLSIWTPLNTLWIPLEWSRLISHPPLAMGWRYQLPTLCKTETNVEGPIRERAKIDLLLGYWGWQVTEVTLRKRFGTGNHSSISFKIVMEKDRAGTQVKVPHCGKSNLDCIRDILANVDWSRLFAMCDGNSWRYAWPC